MCSAPTFPRLYNRIPCHFNHLSSDTRGRLAGKLRTTNYANLNTWSCRLNPSDHLGFALAVTTKVRKSTYQESRSAKPMAGLCHVEACRYADIDQYAILASSIVVSLVIHLTQDTSRSCSYRARLGPPPIRCSGRQKSITLLKIISVNRILMSVLGSTRLLKMMTSLADACWRR